MRKLFTSESVTPGHPDKLCDRISDAILDAMLEQDPLSRVACETFCTAGVVTIMGEVTTHAKVDVEAIARRTILDVGYDSEEKGIDGRTCEIAVRLHRQSPDIALGVDRALETRFSEEADTGAGDQGMMFGYACRETPEMMPLPISLSHQLAKRLTQVRMEGALSYLRPDGKTQVTVEYEDGRPLRVDTVVLSTQHNPDVELETIRRDVMEQVILPVIPTDLLDERTKYFINPTGRFVIGGPEGDTGLTGRKIIVDTYGGYARHGGGAFSGKDPTKVDRSGAYAARYVAKNVVAAGLADRCEVQIAYAIGVATPVSIMVDTFGTGIVSDDRIAQGVRDIFDLRPAAIIRAFHLRRPIYRPLSAYGHMGRVDLNVPWEETDRALVLKQHVLG